MIHEVEGDILLSTADAIAHGIAANDPMDQGLALSLHERYPSMHKDFHHWCHTAHPKPGEAWLWGSADGSKIINLITQEGGYGHGSKPGKATTANVNHALRALKKIATKEGFASLALPRLATGVGGLDWDEVRPLIQSQLGDLGIPVYVYTTYRPNQAAKETAA
ncbi:MAG: macro domain-containing protein [Bdellovibrionales bacterium]|nr:macro domain-containing protein [Bdellovibrionales bacterium]